MGRVAGSAKEEKIGGLGVWDGMERDGMERDGMEWKGGVCHAMPYRTCGR